MRNSKFLILAILVSCSNAVFASEAKKDEPPILVTLTRDAAIDLPRVIDTANREFLRVRIAWMKEHIARNEARFTIRIRHELQAWEKALADLKDTGKVFAGCQYVTISEEPDRFVVAYYESTTMDQFICILSKKDYSPLPRVEAQRRFAWNASQTHVVVE